MDETYIKMVDCEDIQKLCPYNRYDYFAVRSTTHIFRWGRNNNPRPEYLWLPDQSQLQEMVGGFEAGFIDWFHWRNTVYPKMQDPLNKEWRFSSWEQLWLAFVMKELHKKKWTGGKWDNGYK